jgi:hypothetical protein
MEPNHKAWPPYKSFNTLCLNTPYGRYRTRHFFVNFFFDVQISYCTVDSKMRPAVHWSLYGLLACFQNMPTEVSGAKILILHPLYAGSHELVLRYTIGIISKMAKQTFFQSPQIKIRKFVGSFRFRKSAYFLGIPVCKSQIRKVYN